MSHTGIFNGRPALLLLRLRAASQSQGRASSAARQTQPAKKDQQPSQPEPGSEPSLGEVTA